MILNKGQKLFVLHYFPDIYLEIQEVRIMSKFNPFYYESCYETITIIGNESYRSHFWFEDTLNLNKLIKDKYNKRFVSINEDLVMRKFSILLQYVPKKKI